MRRVRAVRGQRTPERCQAHAADRRRQTAGLLGRVSAVGLDQLSDRDFFDLAVALLVRRPGLRVHEANG